MSAAIVYYSEHHGNTRQLAEAIAAKFGVTLIDVTKDPNPDLSAYEIIGFGSGIYFSKFAKQIMSVLQNADLKGKRCFTLFTYGSERDGYGKDAQEAITAAGGTYLGKYGCPGLDTYGPFRLIGGLSKGRPNKKDCEDAVKFFSGCQVFRF